MNCNSCGFPFDPSSRLCPNCRTPRPLNRADFAAAENAVMKFFDNYRRRVIQVDAYQQGLRAHTLADPDGSWWSFDPQAGHWLHYVGGVWRDTGLAYTSGPPGLPQASRGERKGGWKRWLGWGIGLGALLIAAYAAAAWFLGGAREYLMLPQLIAITSTLEESPQRVALSPAQAEVSALYGAPDGFDILFYQEEQEDGSIEDVRSESWRYYAPGLEFTFINGEKVGEDELEPLPGTASLMPAGYLPEQFSAGMTLDEIAALTGSEDYLLVPLDDALVKYGRLYYAPQLNWGFKGNQLAFVHALAILQEGQP
jgi:hypothetical protein